MTIKNSTIMMLVLGACLSRLIPHWPNFTALGAMALFAGVQISSRRVALFIPLVSLFLSDLLLGFHETMFFVYAAVALIALLGRFLRTRLQSEQKSLGQTSGLLMGASLFSSFLFFVITNLGVWLMTAMYPHSASGLMTCFVMAIPFFHNQILGDLFFTGVIFGAFALIQVLSRRFISSTSLR